MNVVDCSRTWTLAAVGVAAALVAGLGLVPVEQVAADSCGAACRNSYNQCRIATKGSSSCESQFTSCMQGCRRK
jgi:hypothetical protein